MIGEIGTAVYLKKHVVPIRLDDAEYHDDLLMDMLNLDNIDVRRLGKVAAARKMCNAVLLNRANSNSP